MKHFLTFITVLTFQARKKVRTKQKYQKFEPQHLLVFHPLYLLPSWKSWISSNLAYLPDLRVARLACDLA